MAFVEINPDFRASLAQQGLTTAADFLAMPGIVSSGHPDRNVSRVTLGRHSEAIAAILKREHRTRWRDRLQSALAGFGLASKSLREFTLLRMLATAEIGCPEPIAAGQDDKGRAFLLVREVEQGRDVRQVLREMADAPLGVQHRFARLLGAALARMHRAGFAHGDLYCKHVLADATDTGGEPKFYFLDWQRARRRGHVGWTLRWRDLAALDATLADTLATPRQRLRVLHAYLRHCQSVAERAGGLTLAAAALEIRRLTRRLLERRRIREMRQPALAPNAQNLIWLDGEAVQVTREFRDELGPTLTDFKKGTQLFFGAKKEMRPLFQEVPLGGSRFGNLVTRWASRPWVSFWAWLLRKPVVAPEVESMKVIFHLQRYGVVLPRLLAAGQKNIKPWEIQSFLLTEPLQGAVALPKYLAGADRASRRRVLRETGLVLRQLHAANCYTAFRDGGAIADLLAVSCPESSKPTVALTTVHGIEKSRHPNPARVQRDLAAMAQALAGTCSQTDLLRGLLSYVARPRLAFGTKLFVRRVLNRLPASGRSRRTAA